MIQAHSYSFNPENTYAWTKAKGKIEQDFRTPKKMAVRRFWKNNANSDSDFPENRTTRI